MNMNMKKKVLILNGATRKNGNTDIIINKIIEGADNSEVEIEQINVRDKNIEDCIGCYVCHKKDKCSINDDMNEIYNSINNSDTIVFASPIYWWGVTGIMKVLIDRLYFYYSENNKKQISGKKAIVIAPMSIKKESYETNLYTEFYKIAFRNLEMIHNKTYYFDKLYTKGAIVDKTPFLEQAYRIGSDF